MCHEVAPPSESRDSQPLPDEGTHRLTALALAGMKRKRDLAIPVTRTAAFGTCSCSSTSEKDNSMEEGDSSDSDKPPVSTETLDQEQAWLRLLSFTATEGKRMVEWLEKVVAISEPSSGKA
jgi:hypothetical protein